MWNDPKKLGGGLPTPHGEKASRYDEDDCYPADCIEGCRIYPTCWGLSGSGSCSCSCCGSRSRRHDGRRDGRCDRCSDCILSLRRKSECDDCPWKGGNAG